MRPKINDIASNQPASAILEKYSLKRGKLNKASVVYI